MRQRVIQSLNSIVETISVQEPWRKLVYSSIPRSPRKRKERTIKVMLSKASPRLTSQRRKKHAGCAVGRIIEAVNALTKTIRCAPMSPIGTSNVTKHVLNNRRKQ